MHAVLDNFASHKHLKVPAWLGVGPFHFTPTSASWLKAVENFFSKTRPAAHAPQRLPLGCRPAGQHHSYLAEHNASPKPFVWAKSAQAILANSTAALYIRLIRCTSLSA
jgi:hypothetical protein